MKRFLGILAALAWLSVPGLAALGDDKTATPILDKAIAALGGEAKLAKASSATWKGDGSLSFNGNEATMKTVSVVDGLDRHREEFDMEFNGMPVKGLTVLNGKKAWRKFGDNAQELDDDMVASTRQNMYLRVVAANVLPLKSKEFQVEAAPDAKVGDKAAAVIKAKGPDGKPFTLYFDKETGLPLKLVATIKGFQGDEVEQETTFSNYKDFDGIKRATKSESKRDGNSFAKMEYSDLKLIEKPNAAAFAEPD